MRSPLMAVSGYLELLDLDNDRLDEDHREFVAQALDGARTLVRLIDAMLDTDRLEAGQAPAPARRPGPASRSSTWRSPPSVRRAFAGC